MTGVYRNDNPCKMLFQLCIILGFAINGYGQTLRGKNQLANIISPQSDGVIVLTANSFSRMRWTDLWIVVIIVMAVTIEQSRA